MDFEGPPYHSMQFGLPVQSHLLHPGHLAVLPLVQLKVFDLADVRPHASVTRRASDSNLK